MKIVVSSQNWDGNSWKAETSVDLTPIDFSSEFVALMGDPFDPASVPTVNVVAGSVSFAVGPTIELQCILRSSSTDSHSRLFLLKIPYESIISPVQPTIIPTIVVPQATNANSGGNTGGFSQNTSGIVRTNHGYVNVLWVYGSMDRHLPLVYTSLDGAKVASMDITLPSYPSPDGSDNNSDISSISQRPLFLTGFDDWLVADGLHGQLIRCSPWWQ